jgi:uncharacterized protein
MIFRLSTPALIGFFLAAWSPALLAQDQPPADLPAPPEGHVLDLADVLDATTEARIERVLAETGEKTGVEVDVVTLGNQAGHGGLSEGLEDYATRLFADWLAAEAADAKGILILVTTDPPDARIALGGDYPAVYDERAARVLGAFVLPAFREGRIADGIEAGIVSARDQLVAPFVANAEVTASEGFPAPVPALPSTLPYILLAAGIFLAVMIGIRRRARTRRTCPNCGELALKRTYEVIEAPDGSSRGSGIEHQHCRSCGYTDREVHVLSMGMLGTYRRHPVK